MTTTTTSNKIVAPIANKPIVVAATPGLAVQLLTAGSAACVAVSALTEDGRWRKRNGERRRTDS